MVKKKFFKARRTKARLLFYYSRAIYNYIILRDWTRNFVIMRFIHMASSHWNVYHVCGWKTSAITSGGGGWSFDHTVAS